MRIGRACGRPAVAALAVALLPTSALAQPAGGERIVGTAPEGPPGVPRAAAARGSPPVDSATSDARNAVTFEGDATFANGSIKGTAFDRRLYWLAVRYGRILVHNETLSLSYAPEIVPAAWLSQPVIGPSHWAVQRSRPPLTHTETTYGAGASPIGFELRFKPDRMIQPLVGTDGGFLYFTRNVPSLFAARFNYIIDVRLGARLPLTAGRAMSVEYVYHHLSNAYRAEENPGVDSQMVSVSYGFGFRGR